MSTTKTRAAGQPFTLDVRDVLGTFTAGQNRWHARHLGC